MFKYQKFKDEIIRVFSGLIRKYELTIIDSSSESFNEVRLVNINCELRFTYSMGEVACQFVDPKTPKQTYKIYPVWKFLYPNDVKKYGLGEFGFEAQLYHLADLISERFSNVLMGDFSWANEFNLSNQKVSKQIEFIVNKLDAADPIKVKFWKGDQTWREDLEKYLLTNEIEL